MEPLAPARPSLGVARKGLSRKEAYGLVQKRACEASEGGKDLESVLLGDREIRAHLTEEEIRSAFDLSIHTRHVHALLSRAGIVE